MAVTGPWVRPLLNHELQGVLQAVQTVVLYVSVLLLMFSLHWRLAALSIVVMPFLAYTAIQYGTKVRPMYSRVQRQWAQLTAVLQENVTGVRVVKAFAREQFEVDKFAGENVAYNFGYADPTGQLMLQWWNSPEHRANILGSKYTVVGIGVATGASGRTYGVMVFGSPA